MLNLETENTPIKPITPKLQEIQVGINFKEGEALDTLRIYDIFNIFSFKKRTRRGKM